MEKSSESPSWYQPPIQKEITNNQIDKISQSSNLSEMRQSVKDISQQTSRSPWEIT